MNNLLQTDYNSWESDIQGAVISHYSKKRDMTADYLLRAAPASI